jgi:hypothetical protein
MLVIDNKKKLNHCRQSTLNNRYPTPHNQELATTSDSDTRQSKVSSLTTATRQPITNNNDHQQVCTADNQTQHPTTDKSTTNNG